MRPNPLAGRRGYWCREFKDTGERVLDKVLTTLTGLGGGDLLVLKVMDGLTWQGQIDPLTPVRSVDDLLAVKAQCEARGVAFCPVVVPRGANVAGEAAAHAAVAQVCGALITDIEPYEGLWDQSPHALIPDYCRGLRAAAPAAYLVNQPDPRPYGRGDAYVDETARYYDGIAAQHYVGWTEVGWTNVDAEVSRFEDLAGLGLDMYVTLWGVGDTSLACRLWQRIADRALGYHCFAFGPMNAAQLGTFASLQPPPHAPAPSPGPKPPAPAPSDSDLVQIIRLLLSAEYAAARDYIARFVTDGTTRGLAPRKHLVRKADAGELRHPRGA